MTSEVSVYINNQASCIAGYGYIHPSENKIDKVFNSLNKNTPLSELKSI